MLQRHAPLPDEGQRNREDLVEMLFTYAAKVTLLGDFCDFHFDARSHCVNSGIISWYIGNPHNPEYGCCTDNLYTADDQFNEDKCCEWIDALHEFVWRFENGKDIHGTTKETRDQALLDQFVQHGKQASFHYADDTVSGEWRLGHAEEQKARELYNKHPDLQDRMTELAKGFIWNL